jgi:poly-gamma-glutamate synthesis protein (capsule biosynthesis protein)
VDEVIDAAWTDTPTLALVPFDRLSPELAVFAVDGENPLENAARFDPDAYPLIARIYAHTAPTNKAAQQFLAAFAERTGGANRNPDHLTVIAMTGVTAMVRQTAFQMDQFGPDWPAKVVGPELAAADITAISNEVPFVPGCQTNTDLNNLVFCSKPEYMAALELVGADIIGLTGNHQNDYGRQDALKSLEIYAEAGLPVYGGGANKEEAFAPLYLEHNGNRLAFLGANSYGPKFAWATDDQPGSAEFDLNIMSATIRNIKAKDKADVVLAELQYQESYDVTPLMDQRQNFRALSQAGADIVTGVQSHVPQAMEFEDGKLILYGLGNLFFDQMWSMSTREGLIVKHTIYEGRHIGTQVLTTMLYDYGQPRWASPEERTRILKRVFGASYWDRRR